MALLITSAAMIGVFPLALRNASLVALLTVGIPTVLLALGPGRDRASRAA